MEKVSKKLDVARLGRLVERLEGVGEDIPTIEIDILLEELRRVYDDLCCMRQNGMVIADASDENENKNEDENENQNENQNENENEKVSLSAELTAYHENENTDEETGILLTDTDAEPVYAEEADTETPAPVEDNQPTVEEVEGRGNDDLFAHEETSSENEETSSENDIEDEKTPSENENQEEEPKTLWDKLQQGGNGVSIADKIAPARTVSDMLNEKVSETTEDAGISNENENRNENENQKENENKNENENESQNPKEQEQREPKATPQPSLFDYVKSTVEKTTNRTIADSLGETRRQHEGATGMTNRVTDLRTVININDKFSFMNELFHNNMKGYNDFILRLNATDDKEEALRYVDEISAQYGWDNESLAVKTFYSIFERKFG